MGTNFYTKIIKCKYCKNSERVHLGKSSIGWKFTLQANGYRFYKNWDEMKEWLRGRPIKDEYGKRISRADFIKWVESKQGTIDPECDYGSQMAVINGYKFYDCEFS